MGELQDLSYCELRAKEIVNIADGRRLGRIIDIVFSGRNGEVRGIVVPFSRRIIFSRNQEVFIPWECISKIGEDVILVAIEPVDNFSPKRPKRGFDSDGGRHFENSCKPPRHDNFRPHHDECKPPHRDDCKPPHHDECKPRHEDNRHFHNKKEEDCDKCDSRGERPNCDRKCEKCMLFDCAYRWDDTY